MVCIIVMHVIGYRWRAEMINSSCSHGLRPRHVAGTLAIIACSATGFQATKPLAQCNPEKFRGLTPSLALWLTIHLSLSLVYLVASIHIKFRSGLATNL
jgi:hypothetical protein